jgi:hypothetical protein
LSTDLHPYVVFLPSDQKARVLSAIFGSKAAVDILKFSLQQGISSRIYQKELVKKLNYSNKTVIGNLKSLTKLGVLTEAMEKVNRNKRITWVKAYQLSDAGRWFALLIAKESDLSNGEKAAILQSLFRSYIRWVKDLSEKLHVDKRVLECAFVEEMSAGERV